MHPLIKQVVHTQKAAVRYVLHEQYTFDVDIRLNKAQIRKLFKVIYDVDIVTLRTHRLPAKRRRGRLSRGLEPRYKRTIFRIKQSVLLTWPESEESKTPKGSNQRLTTAAKPSTT